MDENTMAEPMANNVGSDGRSPDLDYDHAMDRDTVTLSRHVLQQLQSFSPDAQDLSALMGRIALAGKMVAKRLTRAGLVEDALGFTGRTNVQGEAVKRMDLFANQVFISVFKQSGLVCRLASEEMEKPYYIPENCPIGRYTLVYDPIDGSSNVDINLNVGSIFAIRRQEGEDLDGSASDLLQDGSRQIAAGYILYGPSTMLVYSIGKGVHAFTLDPSLGEFILSAENIQIPKHGPVYSVNEGNFWQWDESIRDYIRYMHRHDGYSARYSGALVGDFQSSGVTDRQGVIGLGKSRVLWGNRSDRLTLDPSRFDRFVERPVSDRLRIVDRLAMLGQILSG